MTVTTDPAQAVAILNTDALVSIRRGGRWAHRPSAEVDERRGPLLAGESVRVRADHWVHGPQIGGDR